jgi:hypothetical protein
MRTASSASAAEAGAGTLPSSVSRTLSRFGLVWVPELERGRVRLERRVGPVALVLGLEEIALELETRDEPVGDLDLELVERREDRLREPALPELRPDRVRELPGNHAFGRAGAVAAAGVLSRVEDAEADPVVEKLALGRSPQRVVDRAVGAACELPVPAEVDLLLPVPRLEGQAERVARVLDLEIVDLDRQRGPVPVAHGDVEAAQKLDVACPDVAEIDSFELAIDRTGAELAPLDRRLVPPVPDAMALGCRRGIRHTVTL